MPVSMWSLQDAKNKFSSIVAAAHGGEPQTVTRRGRPEVVVISLEEYERLKALEKAEAPRLATLLLSMPKDDGEFDRLDVQPRDITF